ncbi:hypothetical protein [Hyalangium gracile]|uniref:hypothetical protein n=1 Tax=Hyalangium gracile TaxID=394092 RepID=UPI001CCF0193|nr:hypothetical protein [Hyalangium gracile]
MSSTARWKLPLAIGLVAVVVAVLFAVLGGKPTVEPPPREATTPAPAPPPAAPARPAAPALSAGSQADPLDRFLMTQPDEAAAAPAGSPVKLEELRAKLPDNLYWELDAPTTDPQVLEKRAEAKRKWNEVFGKIQSGDATEEEIHRYYDYRRKRSEDNLAIANLMISEYGDKLREEERGLIDLSIRMHQDRLKEVPRQTADALERKALQDKRREEWIRNGKKP